MAFGIVHYDVMEGAPQFPGYIVYIAIAQAVNGLLNNPQQTMVWISIISTGLAAVAIFALGRIMFNPATGIIASLFLISSPLFWFYGEIALPHALDLFAITFSAYLLYRIMIGQTRWLWLTVAFLALVGGFRQQDLLFLAPVIIFSCYHIGLWRIIGALILGGLVTLAWFMPLMALSGGIRAYVDGSAAFSASFFTTTSLLDGAGEFGLKRNILNKLIPYTLYAWSMVVLPVLYWLPQVPRHFNQWLSNRKVWFVLLWIAPTIVFYSVIHMGQQGLVFVFFPALVVISAEGLYRLFQSRPTVLWSATALIVLFGAAVFILAPTYPLGANSFKLLTYSTLRKHDQLLENQIAAVKTNFKSTNTLLMAENWRFFQYYLPDYKFIRFTVGAKFEVGAGQATGADYVNRPVGATDVGLPARQDWHIAIVDQNLEAFAVHRDDLKQVSLPNGYTMSYLPMEVNDLYITDGKTYTIGAG
jgi:4-amino-4-deoxy-L-arabinose transferase-like glycosyltransferase